jgi:hypothetical protein
MRSGRKSEFIYTPVEVAENAEGQKRGTAKLLAVNLGADYCAEHEWGIKKLKEMFGISDKISDYGLKRRKVSKLPKNFCWISDASRGGFVVSNWFARVPADFLVDSELAGKGLRTAWSESDFGAIADTPEEIEKLQEIYKAFEKKNIIVCFSKTLLPAFENPGLCLVIADRLDKSILDEWKKADKEAHQLRKDVEKTGVEKLLKEKGCQYFALSPQRQEDGSIQYWLNPYDQDRNNFGWYRLEDLQDWAEGKGKIPMSKAQLEERAARRRR